MLCMTNFARAAARRGRAGSDRDAGANRPRDKSRDILDCDSFSHYACGREFTYWMRPTGYLSAECWRVGENLAWGSGEYGTVRSIFRAWMRSPEHRANILGDFSQIGIDLQTGTLERHRPDQRLDPALRLPLRRAARRGLRRAASDGAQAGHDPVGPLAEAAQRRRPHTGAPASGTGAGAAARPRWPARPSRRRGGPARRRRGRRRRSPSPPFRRPWRRSGPRRSAPRARSAAAAPPPRAAASPAYRRARTSPFPAIYGRREAANAPSRRNRWCR